MSGKKSATQKRKAEIARRRQQQERRRYLFWSLFPILVVIGMVGLFISRNQTADTVVEDLPTAPEIGALAPDFELTSNEGELLRLSDFRGQPVAVMFMHTW